MIPRVIPVALCIVGSFLSRSLAAQAPAVTLGNGWLADASRAFLNAHPARGRFQGRPFVVRQALFEKTEVNASDPKTGMEAAKDYDGYALYLASGTSVTEDDLVSVAFGAPAPADRFEIALTVQPGKSIGHRTITVSSRGEISGVAVRGGKEFLEPGAAPIQVNLMPRGATAAEAVPLETAGLYFTLRLRIDAATETALQGAIYLCVNDAQRSFVEGRFTARAVDALSQSGIIKRLRALEQAIRNGDAAGLRALLKDPVNPNKKLYPDRDMAHNTGAVSYETLLTVAVTRGAPDCVQALLAAGADVNLPNGAQRTPLMVAASGGNVKLVDLLLTHGAKVERVGTLGRTALHVAVRRAGNVAVCQQLAAAGADVNATDDDGSTPLIDAVRCEQLDMARWLVDHHADVNHQDKRGHAAFYYADTDAMRVLLYQAGAEP